MATPKKLVLKCGFTHVKRRACWHLTSLQVHVVSHKCQLVTWSKSDGGNERSWDKFLFPSSRSLPNLFLDLKWVTAPKNRVLLQWWAGVFSAEKQHLQWSECHVVTVVHLKSTAARARCPINLPVPNIPNSRKFTCIIYYMFEYSIILYIRCPASFSQLHLIYQTFSKANIFHLFPSSFEFSSELKKNMIKPHNESIKK